MMMFRASSKWSFRRVRQVHQTCFSRFATMLPAEAQRLELPVEEQRLGLPVEAQRLGRPAEAQRLYCPLMFKGKSSVQAAGEFLTLFADDALSKDRQKVSICFAITVKKEFDAVVDPYERIREFAIISLYGEMYKENRDIMLNDVPAFAQKLKVSLNKRAIEWGLHVIYVDIGKLVIAPQVGGEFDIMAIFQQQLQNNFSWYASHLLGYGVATYRSIEAYYQAVLKDKIAKMDVLFKTDGKDGDDDPDNPFF